MEELENVFKELDSNESPGSEVTNFIFYPLNWGLFKRELYAVDYSMLRGDIRGNINHTFITLIPKETRAIGRIQANLVMFYIKSFPWSWPTG